MDAYKKTSDQQPLAVLYQRYTDLVFGVCLKYLKEAELAKDASLDIYEELVTKVKKHEVEKKLLESDFADDALEGLKEIKDKQQISYMVDMLNRDLKNKLQKKKQRREKMNFTYRPKHLATQRR